MNNTLKRIPSFCPLDPYEVGHLFEFIKIITRNGPGDVGQSNHLLRKAFMRQEHAQKDNDAASIISS